MARFAILPILTLTLLFCTIPISGAPTVESLLDTLEYIPDGTVEYRTMSPIDITRRELRPFEYCMACRCCKKKDPKNCSWTGCCSNVYCNLPNKPPNMCAFVPKTCSCTSCGPR